MVQGWTQEHDSFHQKAILQPRSDTKYIYYYLPFLFPSNCLKSSDWLPFSKQLLKKKKNPAYKHTASFNTHLTFWAQQVRLVRIQDTWELEDPVKP